MVKKRYTVVLTIVGLLVASCAAADAEAGSSTSTAAPPFGGDTSPQAPATTASPTEAGFPVMIEAANGMIEVPEVPAAIVSLSPTLTEMTYAIGAGDQLVAVDSFSNYPESAPVTDLSGFAPNVEAIVALDADLVLIDGDYDGSGVASMTKLGVPVLVLPAAAGLDEVYSQIETLGHATGRAERAAALVDEMRAEIEETLAAIPEFDRPLTFYHELDDTYYSVTSETFIGHVYRLMGLSNIADAVGEGSFGYPQLSEEYILEQDPDLIFLADTICCGVSGPALADRPGWDTLTAVQRGAVVELDDDIASRWGPRIVEHIRAVAEAIGAVTIDGS